jgi:hypothetical protein
MMIWKEIQPILKWLKTTTVSDATKADEAQRLIEAVLDWLRLPTNLDRRTAAFRSPAYANIRAKRGPKPKSAEVTQQEQTESGNA